VQDKYIIFFRYIGVLQQ